MMEIFLDHFSEYNKDYRNILIMDNASWHTTKNLKQYNNIRCLFLPPYSPELNPAEHLWEYIRENYFHNKIWNSIKGVCDQLVTAFRDIAKIPKKIISMTKFKWFKF